MMMKKIAVATLFASVALAAHAGTELVTNGDFETGDVAGWTEAGNLAGGAVFPVATDPVNSSNILAIFAVDSPYYVSQNLQTRAGQSYNLSFDLQVQGVPATPGAVSFEAYFNGVKLVNVVDQTMEWTHFSFNNLRAGSALTELKFGGRDDPDFIRLDNVSVSAAPVPEPETYAMLLAGLGLLGFAACHKKAIKLA